MFELKKTNQNLQINETKIIPITNKNANINLKYKGCVVQFV